MEVVEGVDKSLKVTAVPHLIGIDIMLEESSVDVVVTRIPVHLIRKLGNKLNIIGGTFMLEGRTYESIQEDCIEWHAPVLRRRCILMIFPLAPVVQWINRRFVLIKIVLCICWIIPVRGNESSKEEQQLRNKHKEQHNAR